MDDNKMSIKVIDWCSIYLINVYIKDNIEDKAILSILN